MFESQALLTLMSEGKNTGMVLDSGDGVSHVIPVLDGVIFQHGINKMNLAGRHLTNYMARLLTLRGYAFNSSADFEIVREIKENVCFVSYDTDKDRKLALETTILDKNYRLPDGSHVKVGSERFQCCEALFDPSLTGSDQPGMANMLNDTLSRCDISTFRPLVENIILSGGTTMFAGFSSRLEKELINILTEKRYRGNRKNAETAGICVSDPPRRKHAVFGGGSFLANLSPETAWVTHAMIQENGPRVLF